MVFIFSFFYSVYNEKTVFADWNGISTEENRTRYTFVTLLKSP